jgi:hypothetical protein
MERRDILVRTKRKDADAQNRRHHTHQPKTASAVIVAEVRIEFGTQCGGGRRAMAAADTTRTCHVHTRDSTHVPRKESRDSPTHAEHVYWGVAGRIH